jgi:O-acetyl-ADP-ribose deacetylase
MRIEASRGDITQEEVDAIVNAANSALAGGGGVDGAIHRAAGHAELQSACRSLGGCETGDAKATPGFALRARWVIHTVGPVWRGGDAGEAELLASCYRRCVEVAEGLGARSLAFPAISTGIYGYPRDDAARIAVSTLRSVADRTAVSLARLIAFDPETLRLYESLLAG